MYFVFNSCCIVNGGIKIYSNQWYFLWIYSCDCWQLFTTSSLLVLWGIYRKMILPELEFTVQLFKDKFLIIHVVDVYAFLFKMIIMFIIFYALFCVKQEMNIPAESQHTAFVCPLYHPEMTNVTKRFNKLVWISVDFFSLRFFVSLDLGPDGSGMVWYIYILWTLMICDGIWFFFIQWTKFSPSWALVSE